MFNKTKNTNQDSFSQKVPGRIRLKHTFLEKYLQYEHTTSSQGTVYKIPYDSIGSNPTELKGVKELGYDIAIVAVVFLVIFLYFMNYVATDENSGLGGPVLESARAALLVILLGLFLLNYFSKRNFSLFTSSHGNILVLRDKNHDLIVDKINTHRLGALRKLATIDPFESPYQAWERIKWLNEQGAVTESELSKFREMIEYKISNKSQDDQQTLN